MPVSSVTEHWIKPDAVTINLNHFGDPDYLQVSVLAGAVVMAFKQDVIAYNAAHNYRTWPLQAANTYLELTSAYNVYARLTRSEMNASALIVYDPILRDIEGRPISLLEDGTEVLGEADPAYFYVFLGQISESLDNNGNKRDREWLKIIQYGSLDSSEQKNNFGLQWEKLFKPHYDDPADPDKLSWIEVKANMGVQGGVTMFVKGDKINIPTIAEGLPFDEKTIWFNPTTKQIEVIGGTGGGSGEGCVSSFWELNGIPTWITIDKPVYSYSEIKNTPDLSVYALKSAIPSLSGYATEQWVLGKGYATTSDLDGRINALINGAPQAYDTLKEIADVLQGNVNSIGDILTTLGNKADKATTLGGYGITDAYTKTNVDNLLKGYVTIAGTEDVTGIHNFTNGIKVGGIILKKSDDGVVYIDGNLVVKGGVSMYGDENADIPTIFDGLPIDNVTIYWENTSNGKVLKAKVGTEGAITEITSAMVISALGFTPYDASNPNGYITSSALNGYATQTWVKNQGYLTSHQDLSGYQPLITSTNKLSYSLISGTPTSLKNPNALSFGSKSYDGSAKITLTASDLGALTSHQTIYTLTFQSGTFASGSFTANSANKTINVPTTTSHISEGSNLYFTNARAVSALTDTLKAYVTLAGTQTITGEKNFTGGLKVNGSPLVYNKESGYWKLEGDLLVTGGVSMFASDTEFTPSTIMDAIVVDNVTIIKQDGKLVALGGGGTGGGGIADSVEWGNVLGKPAWITDSAPSINVSGVNVSLGGSITQSALRTALGLGSNAYTSTSYLPLTGGTLTNMLTIASSSYTKTLKIANKDYTQASAILFMGNSGDFVIRSTYASDGSISDLRFNKSTLKVNGKTVYHSGNFTPSDYLPLSGGALTGNLSLQYANPRIILKDADGTTLGSFGLNNDVLSYYKTADTKWYTIYHSGNFTPSNYLPLSGGVLSGQLVMPNNIGILFKDTDGTARNSIYLSPSNNLNIGYATSAAGYKTNLYGNTIEFRYGTSRALGMTLNSSGNITIGSSDLASTTYKLYVDGTSNFNGNAYFNASVYSYNSDKSFRFNIRHNVSSSASTLHLYNIKADGSAYGDIRIGYTNGKHLTVASSGYIGVGTATPTEKLHVVGNILATGGVTTNDSMTINGIKLYKSQDGVLYLDGNLVVRGGVTMYGSDSESAPSILDSLPIASTTAKGIAQFSSAHFTVTDGIVSIIGSNVGLNQTELESYLTSNKYAKKSDIPTIPTSLKNPYSLTFGSKTYDGSAARTIVASDLGALTSHQSIYTLTIKNSAGTTQLTYTPNSATGSLTLTKSMVGLGNVENTALSTWVGTSKITTLGTITTGTWNGTKIANTYLANSAITISGTSVSLGGSITQSALRTALGLGSNAYSSTAYLPLTGGTLSGQLTLDQDYGSNSNIIFKNNRLSSEQTSNSADNVILINDATNATVGRLGVYGITGVISYIHMGLNAYNGNNLRIYADKVTFGNSQLAYLTSNVASATKLATARTIWGQSFDGTANIDGGMTFANNAYVMWESADGASNLGVLNVNGSNNLHVGYDMSTKGYNTYIDGNNIYLRYGTSHTTGIELTSAGRVSIKGNVDIPNNKAIYFKNSSGTDINSLYFDNSNILHLGYGTSGSYSTKIYGNKLYLHYGSRSVGMLLNSSGNITIGSSDLAGNTYKMYVNGNPAINGTITKYNADKTYRFGISHYGNEARLYNIIDDGSVYGNIRIGTTNSNCIFFDGVNSRIGIKTTTPDYSLDVNGVINTNYNIYAQTTSNTARHIKVSNDVASMSLYVAASGHKGLYDTVNGKWLVYTNGTNTFLPTGNVGIGTASPSCKLHVAGDILSTNFLRINTNNSTYDRLRLVASSNGYSYIQASNADGTATQGGSLYVTGINTANLTSFEVMAITSKFHGNILATGGVTMQSARKLKNIQDERGLSLEELKIIKPTRFTWKDNRDEKIHIGGIADDVMKVLPEVIYTTDDDTLTMDYGNAAFAISASLIKPVVSHEQRIKMLEEENERLKREIEQLKWHIA